MAQEYNNKLDSWYSSCPGPVQSVLQWPYEKVSDALHWVTGEPDKVAGAGPTYVTAGQQIVAYGQRATEISAGMDKWTGQARAAYDAKIATLSANLDQLGQAIGKTDQILTAAAETCVEAANMILDIIKMVIEFLISSLAIALATAIFTFGASVAAWIASNLANGARALAQIMSGLAKVAKVLEKIASLLEKLATLFKKIAEILKGIRDLLKALKELKKGASIGERLYLTGLAAAVKLPINVAGNAGLAGAGAATGADVPSMPGGVKEGYHAGQDAAGAVQSGNRARETAENNRPPGY